MAIGLVLKRQAGHVHAHVLPCMPTSHRFYHAERALMRQTVRLKHLPGADTSFAGGAYKTLAVAASHPDVITGAGGAGLANGTGDRDEVRTEREREGP